MPRDKMHADELDIDVHLVHRLVASQFPHWADLPLAPVPSAGTDNAIYRLGAELVARLPRSPSRVAPLVNERTWLPRLGTLPLAVPITVAEGAPGEGYPWTWSVYRWLEGDNPTLDRVADLERAAIDLAEFVRALQRLDPTGGPPPGEHNFGRGEPLARRDDATRRAIGALHDELDVAAVTEAWEAALHASPWSGPPLWIHGDLSVGNLLASDGRLAAVIDFGCVGVGDPACDLMIAWTFLVSEVRGVFRSALAIDDATWARGRGWALSTALIALPYYMDTNPVMVRGARHTIAEVLADRAV
jgi:aminoglycoside phosphotransferase (APT) family kinase protein